MQLGGFSAYEECKLWAWAAFGAVVLGLPGQVSTGQQLAAPMDELQGGFQTVPLKVPGSPYAKAVAARQAMLSIIDQQLAALQSQVLPDLPSVQSQRSYHFLSHDHNSWKSYMSGTRPSAL